MMFWVTDRGKRSIEKERKYIMIQPIPCTRFKNATADEWIAKLNEEIGEVKEIAELYDMCVDEDDIPVEGFKNSLMEELTDVITVCVSWLDALGCDAQKRSDLQDIINEKNRARGYFREP